MNEGHSMSPAGSMSNLFYCSMKDLSFLSIDRSNKLLLITQFIKSKINKYQSKFIGSSLYSITNQPRIDYIDRLKSYYRSGYKKMNISLDRLRGFTIKRKEIKSEYQMIKNTSKGIVLSLFFGVNGLFCCKRIEMIKTTPQLFLNFFLLTSAIAISSNMLIQKKIDKKFKKKINTLEMINL